MPSKEQELRYVDALKRASVEFPSGDLVPSEAPDVLIKSPRATVGIEVTVIHLPPAGSERPHQEQQALKDRIVKRAWSNHIRSGGPALYVSVYFASSPLDKASVTVIAEGIAAAVSRTQPGDDPGVDVAVPSQDLPPGIVFIAIRASINRRDQLWHADAGGWVAAVSSTEIQSVVERKRRVEIHARARCDEVWLLIVNDNLSRAAQAELSPEAAVAEYTHCFDSLIWLVPHIPRAVQLRSRRAA